AQVFDCDAGGRRNAPHLSPDHSRARQKKGSDRGGKEHTSTAALSVCALERQWLRHDLGLQRWKLLPQALPGPPAVEDRLRPRVGDADQLFGERATPRIRVDPGPRLHGLLGGALAQRIADDPLPALGALDHSVPPVSEILTPVAGDYPVWPSGTLWRNGFRDEKTMVRGRRISGDGAIAHV